MATKKPTSEFIESTAVEQELDILPEKVSFKPLPILGAIQTDPRLFIFAGAALKSLDWNAIGMSQDEAAKLCWSMAEAMMRNKP